MRQGRGDLNSELKMLSCITYTIILNICPLNYLHNYFKCLSIKLFTQSLVIIFLEGGGGGGGHLRL